MKEIIEENQYAHALEHSMIDETTQKGWAYYAEHGEKLSQRVALRSESAPELHGSAREATVKVA